ncbi:MAG TPA: hypothetical protein VJ717_14715 [Gemmatimonadaceae bacterium]|nr:hypothetical protein [Gemmatimonadaceae bacterium]
MNPSAAAPDPRIVPILRLALLGGAGLLGGVIGFLRPARLEVAQDMANPLTLIGRGIWGVAIAACLFLASRIRTERDPRKVFAHSVIGWGFAESTAVYGAVYWYLLGTSQWYFSGLGFLALALLAMPGLPRRS